MMEHRQQKLIPGSVKLLVYRKGMPVAVGRTANITTGGLYVMTGYTDVDVDQSIEVEFQLPAAESVECYRMAGVVVHKDEQGLGLEIDERNPGLLRLAGLNPEIDASFAVKKSTRT